MAAPESTKNGQEEKILRSQTRMERLRAWIGRQSRGRLYVILVGVTWLLLTLLVGIDSRPLVALGLQDEGRGYEVGNVSRKDIYASRSVTYTDPVATETARTQAAEEAPVTYRLNDRVQKDVTQSVNGFFEEVRKIRDSEASRQEKVSRVAEAAPFYLPENTARSLVSIEGGELDRVENYAVENFKALYSSTAIAGNGVDDSPASVISFSEATTRLSEAAREDASGEVGALVEVISRSFLEPNYVVDRQATERAQEEARQQVAPVTGSIQQGQLVVSRGEVIDEQDLAQLKALGVIGQPNPWPVLLGIGLVVAAEMGVAWYFLERFGQRILRANTFIQMLLAACLVVIFTALARSFVLLSFNPYVIPLAGLSMVGTVLLGPRIMFLMVVISSINVGIIAGEDFFLTAALLLSAGFAIYTTVRVDSRSELLRAGLLIALFTAAVTFAVTLMSGGEPILALQQGAWGLVNGALSLMLAMVLLPVLENAFNILTPMKLLEISDPTSPLLQRLLRKAPGTFSHSMQVGSLAENAAERINANALLARVGGYYHDIGKMEHPAYFVENQISGANPHQNMTSSLSARVIKRHVRAGLEIGHNWNLPEEILNVIARHHGTTRIDYFYRKALESGNGVREEDFRYPGPRPKSKEEGIVMISDSIEAAVKSLQKPTTKRIEETVEGVIRARLDDHQLDDCELTMREIHETGEAVREALIGFIGPRIEYPEEPRKQPQKL
jgi:putative nucleotidyltransferase with HDIG domain